MAMYRNGHLVTNWIKNREAFRIGNVSGRWYTEGEYPEWGRLPGPVKKDILDKLRETDVYVVHSYQTPIAYAYDRTVHVPDESYSATTSGHQSLARAANR